MLCRTRTTHPCSPSGREVPRSSGEHMTSSQPVQIPPMWCGPLSLHPANWAEPLRLGRCDCPSLGARCPPGLPLLRTTNPNRTSPCDSYASRTVLVARFHGRSRGAIRTTSGAETRKGSKRNVIINVIKSNQGQVSFLVHFGYTIGHTSPFSLAPRKCMQQLVVFLVGWL